MAKAYDFYESYAGPHGPHLNSLSDYTRTRKEEDRLRGRAIRGAGKNTAGKWNPGRDLRAAASIQAHLSRHPNDKQSQSHHDWLVGRVSKNAA